MRALSIIASLLGLLLGSAGCTIIIEPGPPPPEEDFEHFRQDWGWGPCAPGEDCSGLVELWSDGTLRLDMPCYGIMDCSRIPAGTYQTVISAADLRAAIPVLTDPALVRLLERDEPLCPLVADLGENMILSAGGVIRGKQTTLCEQAPLQAAREVMADLALRYFGNLSEPVPDPDPEPAPALVETGWSFGLCQGACRGILTFNADQVRFVIRGWDEESPRYVDNVGTLTREGREVLQKILSELAGVMLQDVYGCPDCADGGASHVTLARGGQVTTHTYEFFNPPPALSELDAWRTEIMAALEVCSDTALVTANADCVPRRE